MKAYTIKEIRSLKYSRDDRWSYFGLINEPCFEKATGGDLSRFGLWLDKRRGDEQVALSWLAERLRNFIDLNPEFETAVDRLLAGS